MYNVVGTQTSSGIVTCIPTEHNFICVEVGPHHAEQREFKLYCTKCGTQRAL